jgi:hypothetical protein
MGNIISGKSIDDEEKCITPPIRRNSFDEKPFDEKPFDEKQIDEKQIDDHLERAMKRAAVESYRLPEIPGYNEGINGWDNDANNTINNWFDVCKEYRWRYQFILDRNYQFATRLNTTSIIFSSILSIFSGFKLWQNSIDFQNVSNIVMLISNTIIAGITSLSKRYIDDSRNEKMRNFIENMDQFIGIIHSQAMVAPIYRIQSSQFIQMNISNYTNMMTACPNLSLSEYILAKKKYKEYTDKIKIN